MNGALLVAFFFILGLGLLVISAESLIIKGLLLIPLGLTVAETIRYYNESKGEN